jgi:hypothetical protein
MILVQRSRNRDLISGFVDYNSRFADTPLAQFLTVISSFLHLLNLLPWKCFGSGTEEVGHWHK